MKARAEEGMQPGEPPRDTLLSYFPEQVQLALRAYGVEVGISPEAVVPLAINYFLESADITVGTNIKDLPNAPPNQSILVHLPNSIHIGIEQYAIAYDFPPEFVVEMAVTFFLDPDASSFEDCQIGVRREQVYLLQQYCKED